MSIESNFPMPKSIEINESTATDKYAKFYAAPFQNGFGHTLGNALRRILLSSIEGVAISAVRIDGASHEFASLPSVVEDVVEIVVNLKQIRIATEEPLPITLEVKKSKKGTVTGADILTPDGVKILNPEQVICTLDKNVAFRAELDLSKGRGYVTSEKNKEDGAAIGTVFMDSLFSPVERVRYNVGSARVGEETEMDSLELEVWTDGSIKPQDALEISSKIFQEHLRPFMGNHAGEEDVISKIDPSEQKIFKVLTKDVEMMDLSVRAMNCLANADIKLIGELCIKSEARMLKYRNFGKKSLDEIKEKLISMRLGLGMNFSEELTEAVTLEAERVKEEVKQEGGEE